MSHSDETPPYGVGKLGAVQMLKDKATVPDETPTGEYCPACATYDSHGVMTPGDGIVRREYASGHSAIQCPLCKGNTWCSASDASNWRIRNIAFGKKR